jgi:hypothetical protein
MRSRLRFSLLAALGTMIVGPAVQAAPVSWTDWTGGTEGTAGSATGQLLTPDGVVDVEYTGEIAFLQTGTGTNYFEPAEPYLSALVDNAPPGAEMIALSQAGTRTLTFSQPVEDLFFAVVSLNGNSFTFDSDFEIVSSGCGFWGCGGFAKSDLGGGQFQIAATGSEPHGVIRLAGAISSLTWSSASNEFWYGFTVGTYGIVPEPGTVALMGLGFVALARASRVRRG